MTKNILMTAVAATVAFAAAPSAHAAQFLTITGPSGNFGDDNVTCAGGAATCEFSRTFTFTTPAGFNLASADISSILSGSNFATNLDFSTVTFNGINFNTLSTGVQEFRNLLNQSIVAGGTNTLFVSGIIGVGNNTTTPANASFTGNLAFSNNVNSAVPEPATWAMMLLGFGGMGFALRRRTRTSARIRFA